MIGKKYKANGVTILLYSKEDFTVNEELKFEYLADASPLEEEEIPVFNYKDFMISVLTGKRTKDRILDEEGIRTYKDLKYAYNLIRNKMYNKSARIRDLVVAKYVELTSWDDEV